MNANHPEMDLYYVPMSRRVGNLDTERLGMDRGCDFDFLLGLRGHSWADIGPGESKRLLMKAFVFASKHVCFSKPVDSYEHITIRTADEEDGSISHRGRYFIMQNFESGFSHIVNRGDGCYRFEFRKLEHSPESMEKAIIDALPNGRDAIHEEYLRRKNSDMLYRPSYEIYVDTLESIYGRI